MFTQPSEEHPLPWRYVPLPFDGGGVSRLTYMLIAANHVEICCVSDQRTAQFICAVSTLEQEGRFRSGKLAPELAPDGSTTSDPRMELANEADI